MCFCCNCKKYCHTEFVFQLSKKKWKWKLKVLRFSGMFTAQGWYVFIESSSPRHLNDSARLVSATVPANQQYCLQFYYHMYGANINSLNVYLKVRTQSYCHLSYQQYAFLIFLLNVKRNFNRHMIFVYCGFNQYLLNNNFHGFSCYVNASQKSK